MGRPPKTPEETYSERVVAFLRPAEFRKLERWARERGVRVGQLAREVLERALRRRP